MRREEERLVRQEGEQKEEQEGGQEGRLRQEGGLVKLVIRRQKESDGELESALSSTNNGLVKVSFISLHQTLGDLRTYRIKSIIIQSRNKNTRT